MKATSSAGEPSKPASDNGRPEGSGSSNEGAIAPSGSIIVDAVWAMRASRQSNAAAILAVTLAKPVFVGCSSLPQSAL